MLASRMLEYAFTSMNDMKEFVEADFVDVRVTNAMSEYALASTDNVRSLCRG